MQKADGNIEGDKREVTIEDIAVFIELKARAANHPVFGNVNTDVKSSIVKNDSRKKPRNPTSKTDQGLAFVTQGRSPADQMDHSSSSPSSPTKSTVRWPLCEASHWLTHCELFKAKSFEERQQLARKKGLCDSCLRSGHMAHDCPKESFCQLSN